MAFKARLKSSGIRAVVLGLALIAPSVSAELYKYVNEDGVTVLDSHVPARYVKNGYSILSLDGRIIEVVQRALSDAEIRDRDSELAEQRARETAEREQKIADQNLMRIYGTPEDVVRARDTKLASIEGFITTSRSNLTRLETQKRSLESQLADIERAGGTIGKDRLSQVRSIENRIRSNESEVQEKEGEMEELRADFSSDLKRVRQLYQSPLDD
ncbi:MAG: DNA repair exonuclease SbcCD ATPase subunit [Candidatus Azotimanducaceae bacterium]|jgi:DNA repair exonuclease SbcCD ATPase subunit